MKLPTAWKGSLASPARRCPPALGAPARIRIVLAQHLKQGSETRKLPVPANAQTYVVGMADQKRKREIFDNS
jgi:hypothetical protein